MTKNGPKKEKVKIELSEPSEHNKIRLMSKFKL